MKKLVPSQLPTEKEVRAIFERKLQILKVESESPIERSSGIQERLKLHKRWLETNGQDGQRFQGVKESFQGVDFSHADLRGSEFKSCNFDYCNFYDADLGKSAVFWTCSIREALLISTKLTNTQFISCDIEKCNFQGAIFERAGISGQVEPNGPTVLTFNDFRLSKVANSSFNNFSLSGNKIDNMEINNVHFNACQLQNIDFRGANISGPLLVDSCNCSGINISESSLKGSCFVNSELSNSTFFKSDLTQSDFTHSILNQANFNLAKLPNSKLNRVFGFSCNFFQTDLHDCEIRLAIIRESDFRQSQLYSSDFSSSDLTSSTIDNTTNCNLTNFSGCTWINGNKCKAGSIGVCYQ